MKYTDSPLDQLKVTSMVSDDFKYADARYSNIVDFCIKNSNLDLHGFPYTTDIDYVRSISSISQDFIEYLINSQQIDEDARNLTYGWKFHIAVTDEDVTKPKAGLDNYEAFNHSNLGLAWNVILSILDRNQIFKSKVIKPGKNGYRRDKGKQITIYSFYQLNSNINWSQVVHDIEQELAFHRIKNDNFATERGEQSIANALYVSYRYEGKDRNEEIYPENNPFQSIQINQEAINNENERRNELIRRFFDYQEINKEEEIKVDQVERVTKALEDFEKTHGFTVPLWIKKEYGWQTNKVTRQKNITEMPTSTTATTQTAQDSLGEQMVQLDQKEDSETLENLGITHRPKRDSFFTKKAQSSDSDKDNEDDKNKSDTCCNSDCCISSRCNIV